MERGEILNHPKKGHLTNVEHIRNVKDIKSIKKFLQDSPRDFALFTLCVLGKGWADHIARTSPLSHQKSTLPRHLDRSSLSTKPLYSREILLPERG